MSDNLFEPFQERLHQYRDKPFLVLPGAEPLSFGDMDQQSSAYAGALGAVGVSSGDRVLVQADKCPGSVALYLACLRIGAVYVPLNTAYTVGELEHFLSDAEPRLLVCRPESETELSPLAERLGVAAVETLAPGGRGSLDQAAQHGTPEPVVVQRAASDLAAMLYTSGTTGRPKGAMLSHGNLTENARGLVQVWQWRSDDVLLHALPIFHVHGLFVALHCALLGGSTVIFLDRFSVDAVRAALPDCTVMMGVPTFYTRLLEAEALTVDRVDHMRLFISGSAPLTVQTAVAFREQTGHAIVERYGMTETGMLTSNPVAGERVPGTVGFPLPGVELRVSDAEGRAVPPGEVGTVEVRGANVFKGYWGLPDKTAEDFRSDGFFITGDLGHLDGEGRLALVGRGKDLIISGGYNIYPKEVEFCIDDVPGVTESAVIGVPHPDFGEAVVAAVVSDDKRPASENDIRAALEGVLARF